jgi:hypothetical protein
VGPSSGSSRLWGWGWGTGGERTSQIRAGDIACSVGGEERHRAHQVFGLAHLALGNQGRPLFLQVWVIVEDFLGSICGLSVG